MNRFLTLKDILDYHKEFEGTDSEFNKELLDAISSDNMDQELFLEYLSITQGDIDETLEENVDTLDVGEESDEEEEK